MALNGVVITGPTVLLFVGLWAFFFVVLLASGLWIATRWPRIPAEVPAADRPLYRSAYALGLAEVGLPGRRPMPGGLHRHDARVYAAFVVFLRDVYLADGVVLTRSEREILATSVSVSNRCHFCVHVHAVAVRVAADPGVDERILNRDVDGIADPRIRDLARFGMAAKDPNAEIVCRPPFTADELSDAAAVVFAFHYLNRVMDTLGPKEGLRRQVLSNPPAFVAARMLGLGQRIEPGMGLKRLLAATGVPPAQVDPSDRGTIERIARGRASLSDSILFAWSSVQIAAEALFAPQVLTAIRAHLATWTGEDPPLGLDWADEAVAAVALDPDQRAVARQGLLVARAPFITSAEELLEVCGDRRRRLVLVSFASFAAALRITEWLPMPDA